MAHIREDLNKFLKWTNSSQILEIWPTKEWVMLEVLVANIRISMSILTANMLLWPTISYLLIMEEMALKKDCQARLRADMSSAKHVQQMQSLKKDLIPWHSLRRVDCLARLRKLWLLLCPPTGNSNTNGFLNLTNDLWIRVGVDKSSQYSFMDSVYSKHIIGRTDCFLSLFFCDGKKGYIFCVVKSLSHAIKYVCHASGLKYSLLSMS